jgi:hypothetical protein
LTVNQEHSQAKPSTPLAWAFEMCLRAADNAVDSAQRGYDFAPGSYTYEALRDAFVARELLLELARKAAGAST